MHGQNEKPLQPQARTLIAPREFLRACHRAMFRKKIADSTGVTMTGGSLLMRTLIFRRLLLREVLGPDEKFVGLLVPPSAGGILANAAVTICGRVTVNLNYTVSSDTLNYCIEQCGIRHVITSRRFMERFDFKLNAELVYLEDIREKVTTVDKLAAALAAYTLPAAVLERILGLHKLTADDLFTIIYTSGSTGKPKGVMLSHGNIGSNVAAIEDVLDLTERDVVVGILPLFHSMGFTVGLWAVLSLRVQGAYHFSPLEPKVIGKLVHEHKGTILITTPTFLRSYMRRCTPEEFATLELVVTGAEKLPDDLLEAFEERFGERPMQGYGTTELSPIVALNVPEIKKHPGTVAHQKIGSVGKPIPGCTPKIVDLDTGKELEVGQSGMLLIKGVNVMQGYYQQPEQTAKVLRDGWYNTGDMGMMDSDGFLYITGRLSRFSKIGGEMVPHIHIEELIQRSICDDEEKLAVAVTAVPDNRKGERLIVLHLPMEKTPAEVIKELSAAGLPNLWIPSKDSFIEVEQIPLLGTGKLDLQAVRELAKEKLGAQSAS